jgi:uncharacterized surface protein with fasciclin (FAS1) repeats
MTRLRTTLIAAALGAASLAATAAPASAGTTQERRAAEKDIVATAVGAGEFKTLTSLVRRAGLARTLQGDGPFTVFAPTDAAFAKVPKATLRALGRDRDQLRAVLLYHVANRELRATRVVKRRSIKTLNGERLRIRVRGERVTVGGARVVTPDVAASNGVIHVINKVLIPG